MSDLHNFHYVYTTELDDKLENFIKHSKISKSEGVDSILFAMKHHYQERLLLHAEEKSRYIIIEADKNIWVKICETNYRWIKQIHDMTNTFSMAQVVRKCLEVFFAVAEKFGSFSAAFDHFLQASKNFRSIVKNANINFYDRLKSHMCKKSGKILLQIFIIDESYHLVDQKLQE